MSKVLTRVSRTLLMPLILLLTFYNDNLNDSCVLNFSLQNSSQFLI